MKKNNMKKDPLAEVNRINRQIRLLELISSFCIGASVALGFVLIHTIFFGWRTHSDRPPSEIVRTRTLWITLCINTLDKSPFVCYLILNDMRNLPPLPEATWQITFDNDSTIFIAGRDEAHARRVVENNKGFSRWRRTPECEWVTRTIKKIERVTW